MGPVSRHIGRHQVSNAKVRVYDVVFVVEPSRNVFF